MLSELIIVHKGLKLKVFLSSISDGVRTGEIRIKKKTFMRMFAVICWWAAGTKLRKKHTDKFGGVCSEKGLRKRGRGLTVCAKKRTDKPQWCTDKIRLTRYFGHQFF